MKATLKLRQRFASVRYLFLLMAMIAGLTLAQPAAAQVDPPSTDATLSSLEVSPTGIAGFQSDTYDYTLDVDNGTTSVTLIPVANDSAATIAVNGGAVLTGGSHTVSDLAVGENAIAIVVTAEDGVTFRTYTITVRREPALTLETTYSRTRVAEGGPRVTVFFDVATDVAVRPFRDYAFTLDTENGEATSGLDFEPVSEMVWIPAADFAPSPDGSEYVWSRELAINIIDDENEEPEETFRTVAKRFPDATPPFTLPGPRTMVIVDNEGKPGAPEAILATAGDSRVTLAWAPPSGDGTSPVTGYQYQVKECSGSYGEWTDTDHALATHHTVSGLTNGTEYAFKVRATSAEGPSDASAEAKATPNADFRPVITGDSTSAVGTTFLVTIAFNRDVPELSREALVVHGGHMVAHGQPWRPRMSLPNGREWTAHIEPDFGFTGALTLDIPAGAVKDADGNSSLAAARYTRDVKADHVRPRLYMDLAPVDGTHRYRDPLEPVSGPFTVRIKFVTDRVFHQPVTGLTVDEVIITNGAKTNFRQVTSADGEENPGDYAVTVTPTPATPGRSPYGSTRGLRTAATTARTRGPAIRATWRWATSCHSWWWRRAVEEAEPAALHRKRPAGKPVWDSFRRLGSEREASATNGRGLSFPRYGKPASPA